MGYMTAIYCEIKCGITEIIALNLKTLQVLKSDNNDLSTKISQPISR